MFLFCYNLSFEHKFFVYKLLIQFYNIYYDFCQKMQALAHQDKVSYSIVVHYQKHPKI
jgi:hypothetical protein